MTWLLRLWHSTIGKKAIMALTGLALFGFVIAHLAGNLQIFMHDGGKAIDAYGEFLHSKPGMLWAARIGLLIAVGLHIIVSVQLIRRNAMARPVAYHVKTNREATIQALTMKLSGPMIALFVIYHLLHFTTGQAHPEFQQLKVHHNVVTGFKQPAACVCYIAAMLMLGLHLYHGAWSMFQSLGINHPKYTPILRGGSMAFALLVTAGNISIPLAVMAGVVK